MSSRQYTGGPLEVPLFIPQRIRALEVFHMPFDALILVLLAAFVHVGWNLLLHGTPDREAAMAISGWVTGLAMIPLLFIWPPWHVWPLIFLSGLTQAIYGVLLSAAYQHGVLGISYPVARGTAPLLVTLGGWAILSQRPGPGAISGAILLGVGLIMIALTGRQLKQTTAVVLAILTGVSIASYQVIDASAVQSVNPAGYLGPVFLLQGMFITVWMLLTRRMHTGQKPQVIREAFRQSLRSGTLIAIGSTAAYMLVVFALQRADAGRVATFREFSILLGLLFARQRIGQMVWIGAIFVVSGALLAAF